MPSMHLRQAADVDLNLVRTMSRDAYAPWEPILCCAPLPMNEDYTPRIARHEVWIAERCRTAVGVMVLEPADDHLVIFSLAVPSAHHGQGIGQWMMRVAEQMAEPAGLPELRLYTSDRMTRNIAIYRRAGFHETGRRPNPYREGWVLVDMTKPVFGSGKSVSPRGERT